MGRVSGAVHEQVLSRDCEACQGSGVPRAEARATTVMDYVARFTELARFADDYVATDLAKVRRFENGLKLSIRARIVGLLLQDMDSMVGTALAIEREIEDARNLGMRVLVARGRRVSLLLVQERGRELLVHKSFRVAAIQAGDR